MYPNRSTSCTIDRIVQLSPVQLMSSRHSGQVEMADPGKVLLEESKDISAHDLHVVDVEQHAGARAVHRAEDIHARLRIIKEAIRVIYLRVERLEEEGHPALLANAGYGGQALDEAFR